MATESETKGINRMLYNSVLKDLELEMRDHPETYEGALRIAEGVRQNLIDYAGEDSFKPLPRLDLTKKK